MPVPIFTMIQLIKFFYRFSLGGFSTKELVSMSFSFFHCLKGKNSLEIEKILFLEHIIDEHKAHHCVYFFPFFFLMLFCFKFRLHIFIFPFFLV